MEGNVSGQSDVEGQLEVCCAVTHPGAGFKSTILAIFGEGEADAAEVFGYHAVCGHASSGDVDGGIIGLDVDRLDGAGRVGSVGGRKCSEADNRER